MTSIIKQAEISLSHSRSHLIQHAPPARPDCISLPLALPGCTCTCTLCICGRIRRTRGGASIPTLQGGRRSQKGAVSISGVGGTKTELWGSKLFLGFAISEPQVCLLLSLRVVCCHFSQHWKREERQLRSPKPHPTCCTGTPIGQWWGRMRTSENDVILQIGAGTGNKALGEGGAWVSVECGIDLGPFRTEATTKRWSVPEEGRGRSLG